MMSTAMSRSLDSYSRAWCPQKTRSLPLASTTRTLASAPHRSQWKGTTRSSAAGVVVSVWVIWVITRSLPHGPAAADRPPAQRQDGPLCSRASRHCGRLAGDGEPVAAGTGGGSAGTSLGGAGVSRGGAGWCVCAGLCPAVGPLLSRRPPRYALYPADGAVHGPVRPPRRERDR